MDIEGAGHLVGRSFSRLLLQLPSRITLIDIYIHKSKDKKQSTYYWDGWFYFLLSMLMLDLAWLFFLRRHFIQVYAKAL